MVKKTNKDSDKIKNLKQKSRNLSISEGIFFSMRSSFGDHYLVPFAIAMSIGNSIVAMLSALIGLIGPIAQIFGSKIIEKTPRKKIVTRHVLAESFVWILFILVGFLFYKNLIPSLIPGMFLIIFSAYLIIWNLPIPAWFSWTGEIIDPKYRGRWLSKRNLLIGFSTLILVVGSSFFLEHMKEIGQTILGFSILFFLAFLARLKCWRLFKKMYEPKIELKKSKQEKPFTFWAFLINAPKNNLGKLSLFRFMFSLSIGIGSSVTSIYLLRNLDLSYINYMIIISSSAVFSLLVMGLWGKIADKYGNYRVIALTTLLIPIIPILWIISDSIIYLILTPGIIRGFSWAGFEMGTTNFIYDNVSQEKRGRAFSYYHMMMGLGIFVGGSIGAILIKFLNTQILEPIIIIFIISTILRMAVVYFWIPKIKEIKEIHTAKDPKAFKKFLVKNIRPTLTEETHQIMHMKKYLTIK